MAKSPQTHTRKNKTEKNKKSSLSPYFFGAGGGRSEIFKSLSPTPTGAKVKKQKQKQRQTTHTRYFQK